MKTIRLVCFECGISFDKELREYTRQSKKGRNKFYCNEKCSCKSTSILKRKYRIEEKTCLWCGTTFTSTTHPKSKKCCSKSCAGKRSQLFVDTNKISKGLKRYHTNNPKDLNVIKHCSVCSSEFHRPKWDVRKTCSDVCSRKLISKKSRENPNCGGETNYKKFKYNDVWMDSSWEVNVAKWMDEHSIKWRKDKKMNFLWTDSDGKRRRYYPDFFLEEHNVYLDPKNKFLIEKDAFKITQVQKENGIKIVFGLESDVIKFLESLIGN